MQRLAGELNLSETVFVQTPTRSDCLAKLRIFTPRRELPFAGHPTIGAATVVARTRGLTQGPFALEEPVGPVAVELEPGEPGRVWLTTPPISFHETLDRDLAAALLGLSASDLLKHEPQFVSAGSPLLFVAVRDAEAVDRAALQLEHLPRALGSVNSVGTFVFAPRPAPNGSGSSDVYSRMFAPQTGIPEDPATGGATGPLAAYMARIGMIPGDTTVRFVSEQGTKMRRRSILHVAVNGEGAARTIKVGGSAVQVAEGAFSF